MEKIGNNTKMHNAAKGDFKLNVMCENLMKEMLWAQVPSTIKFYAYHKLTDKNSN